MKNGAFLFFIVLFFLAMGLSAWWKRVQKKSWAESLTIAVYAGGFIIVVAEIYFLGPLLFKGTDGPGGLIVLILPFITFGITMVIGLVVGLVVHAIEHRNPPQIILSPMAQAILNGDPQFIQNSGPRDRTDWRIFARQKLN